MRGWRGTVNQTQNFFVIFLAKKTSFRPLGRFVCLSVATSVQKLSMAISRGVEKNF